MQPFHVTIFGKISPKAICLLMAILWLTFILITVTAGCSFFPFREKSLDYCTKERLKENPTKKDKDYKKLGPGLFVKNYVGTVKPSLETYVLVQIRLEDIAKKHDLYNAPQNETNEILRKLYEDREVKDLLHKCNEYHNVPKCNNSKYRTIDGSCNNLKNPHWGSAFSYSDRFATASYNGISGLRKSTTGKDLPNARSISVRLENKNIPSNQVSAFFSYYGQILVHDLSLGPSISKNGSIIPCCVTDPDPNCIDINVSPDDPFYDQFMFTCIPFARTAPYPQCNFGKRKQMNSKTAFLDVSLIYGCDEKEARQMRANHSLGRLNSRHTPFGEILPHAHSNKTLFCPEDEIEKCFLSGDERVNQHTMVICVQTLLVRLHNNIHDKLIGINPHWNAEKLYQETRRIVIAIQQNMVYKEYLPWLVGPDYMAKYNLSVDSEGSLYDEETRPFLLSEFNTAAFRLHSMLPKAVSKHYPKIRMSLTYSYFCPVYKGQLDAYITGSCEAPSEKYDRFVKVDVTDYLHRPPKASFGVDIAAINIQRGRDHGLAPYIDVVNKCSNGKTNIKTFADLKSTMSGDSIKFLKKIYTDVRDIDLWVGMTVEEPLEGSVIGQTAACISAIQFHRLKFGDSFFFTHQNGRPPFRKKQLETITSFSVARWLCDTTRYDRVRRHPFAVPGEKNPITSCQKIQPLDLSFWKEDL